MLPKSKKEILKEEKAKYLKGMKVVEPEIEVKIKKGRITK